MARWRQRNPVDYFNYRVEWSAGHKKYVGLVAEFPTLLFLHEDPVEARVGIRQAVAAHLGAGESEQRA